MTNMPTISAVVLPGHPWLELSLKVGPEVNECVSDESGPGRIFSRLKGSRNADRHGVPNTVPRVLFFPALMVGPHLLAGLLGVLASFGSHLRIVLVFVLGASLALLPRQILLPLSFMASVRARLAIRAKAAPLTLGPHEVFRSCRFHLFAGCARLLRNKRRNRVGLMKDAVALRPSENASLSLFLREYGFRLLMGPPAGSARLPEILITPIVTGPLEELMSLREGRLALGACHCVNHSLTMRDAGGVVKNV
jgi:hypothetical protein